MKSKSGVILEGGVEKIEIIKDKVNKVAKTAKKIAKIVIPKANAIAESIRIGNSSKRVAEEREKIVSAIDMLKEINNVHKKNIERMAEKATNTKSQQEYQNILEKLAQTQSLYRKNEAQIARINYAMSEWDYDKVAEEFKQYEINQENFAPDDFRTTTDLLQAKKYIKILC